MPADAADEALMVRVANGDMQALGILFERFKQPLFNFLYRVLQRRATAEDVLQDTFIRVFDRRRQYKQNYLFATWLFTIAHHLAIDLLRREAHCPQCENEIEALPHSTPDEAPDIATERRALTTAVRGAIAELPDDLRMIIVLREYQGFSFKEIGAITGISEEAARVRAYRARQHLKTRLSPLLMPEDGN